MYFIGNGIVLAAVCIWLHWKKKRVHLLHRFWMTGNSYWQILMEKCMEKRTWSTQKGSPLQEKTGINGLQHICEVARLLLNSYYDLWVYFTERKIGTGGTQTQPNYSSSGFLHSTVLRCTYNYGCSKSFIGNYFSWMICPLRTAG